MSHSRTYSDPHFCFHVTANDERVFGLIESYLDFRETQRRYSPFFEISYHVEFRDRARLPREAKAAYSLSETREGVRVAKLHERTAEVRLDIPGMRADIILYSLAEDMGIMDFAFLQPCRIMLAHRQWIYVHGAHLLASNHDIVLVGPSGAGKSTVAHALSGLYSLQSDDELFVHTGREQNYCLPFPTRMGFKNDELASRITGDIRYGGKARASLPREAAHFADIAPRACVILLPHYDESATVPVLETLEPSAMYKIIAPFSLTMCQGRARQKESQAAAFILHSFIYRSRCFRLTYNDRLLAGLPNLLAQHWK